MRENGDGETANGHRTTDGTAPRVRVRTEGAEASVHGTPSERVVARLEEELGELSDFALNDYVDPDALDALFERKADGNPRANGSVVFACRGLLVTVHADGATHLSRLS